MAVDELVIAFLIVKHKRIPVLFIIITLILADYLFDSRIIRPAGELVINEMPFALAFAFFPL